MNEQKMNEQEIGNPNTERTSSLVSGLFDVLEMFAWAMFVVLILFTFFFRICYTDGASMENTLHDRDLLLLYSLGYEPEQGDIVVFQLTEHTGAETLVKRIIATGGQELVIDFKKCEIYVDGVLYDDPHATLKDRITDRDLGFYTLTADHHYDKTTQTLTATVPKGHVFVMGDNRNNSKDSRMSEIGFVDERCILGKAVYRLKPFTKFD